MKPFIGGGLLQNIVIKSVRINLESVIKSYTVDYDRLRE